MKVLIIAPPFLKDKNDIYSWTTIPPQGYGGIENVIYTLIIGLIHHGCEITLIGSPGSNAINGLSVLRDVRGKENMRSWIQSNYKNFDVVHDHSCGLVFDKTYDLNFPYIATHHQTGLSPYPSNTVYLSYSQRKQSGIKTSPIIRLPVFVDNFLFKANKENYYLYLGRISEWKGVIEAARICKRLNSKLIIAGPRWEDNYYDRLIREAGKYIEYAGEVSGTKKIDLLANAKALFVLSRFSKGPWGDSWYEPGSTVVGEAAASGTLVISSTNGCLSEIVVPEIGVQLNEDEIASSHISRVKMKGYDSLTAFNYSKDNWNHILISNEYIKLYRSVIDGNNW